MSLEFICNANFYDFKEAYSEYKKGFKPIMYLIILIPLAAFSLKSSFSWEYLAFLLAPSDAEGRPNEDLRFTFLGIMKVEKNWKGYVLLRRISSHYWLLF